MIRFEVGKTYTTRSICDHDCIFTFDVIARSAKTVTIRYQGNATRRKIRCADGCEAIDPMGRFSMAPVLRADACSRPGYQYRSPRAAANPGNMIDIRLAGGVIQDVTNLSAAAVRVFDYDVEGTEPEHLDLDEQGEPCIITVHRPLMEG